MTALATIGECLADGARRLAEAGIPDARREARLILAHALGVAPTVVNGYPERPVLDRQPYEALIGRRTNREPLSHLTGRREFWSLPFEVTAATLDPRPDSETVVEAALAVFPDPEAALTVLDLGTGTGCLLLAVLSERKMATGVGTDIDPAAVAVARRNAYRLGLAERATFVVADWGRALEGQFDIVVANPPYIPGHEIAGLQPEVAQFEPLLALDGGADGLDAYRCLAGDIARLLTAGGAAVVEFGTDQADRVASIMTGAGLIVDRCVPDLDGRWRCLVCRKP